MFNAQARPISEHRKVRNEKLPLRGMRTPHVHLIPMTLMPSIIISEFKDNQKLGVAGRALREFKKKLGETMQEGLYVISYKHPGVLVYRGFEI